MNGEYIFVNQEMKRNGKIIAGSYAFNAINCMIVCASSHFFYSGEQNSVSVLGAIFLIMAFLSLHDTRESMRSKSAVWLSIGKDVVLNCMLSLFTYWWVCIPAILEITFLLIFIISPWKKD